MIQTRDEDSTSMHVSVCKPKRYKTPYLRDEKGRPQPPFRKLPRIKEDYSILKVTPTPTRRL